MIAAITSSNTKSNINHAFFYLVDKNADIQKPVITIGRGLITSRLISNLEKKGKIGKQFAKPRSILMMWINSLPSALIAWYKDLPDLSFMNYNYSSAFNRDWDTTYVEESTQDDPSPQI